MAVRETVRVTMGMIMMMVIMAVSMRMSVKVASFWPGRRCGRGRGEVVTGNVARMGPRNLDGELARAAPGAESGCTFLASELSDLKDVAVGGLRVDVNRKSGYNDGRRDADGSGGKLSRRRWTRRVGRELPDVWRRNVDNEWMRLELAKKKGKSSQRATFLFSKASAHLCETRSKSRHNVARFEGRRCL
jgi:hypothetical protein